MGVHRRIECTLATATCLSALWFDNPSDWKQACMKPVVSLSLWEKCKILFYAIARPTRFTEAEIRHNDEVNRILLGRKPIDEPSKIHYIRSAQFQAFCICLGSTLSGAGIGIAMAKAMTGTAAATAIIVTGTARLLWATLAFQGWSVQSGDGQTLTERVNQWLFRALYAVGTFFISLGSTWAVS